MVLALGYFVYLVRPIVRAPRPALVPADTADSRFGVPEAIRRRVFRAVADRMEHDHGSAAARFPGEPWSVEDDLAGLERDEARAAAAGEHLSLTQVYLILDEGIRQHWLTDYGHPLPATITPLQPRKK